MIAVFIGEVRIGSILHFPHQKYWVAYASNDRKEKFKTRKEAVAWLTKLHNEK